jgi:hypothetical protein
MNLLIRERSDLRATDEGWRRDIATAGQRVDKALATKKKLAERARVPQE